MYAIRSYYVKFYCPGTNGVLTHLIIVSKVRLKKISKEFEKYLAEISVGVISSSDFDKLISLYESEIKTHYFTSSSEANIIRIIQGMYDKISFIRECISYPHYLELIISIARNNFV